jgi:phosphatidylglycerol:prolipoprotein diacylglycerol transferase
VSGPLIPYVEAPTIYLPFLDAANPPTVHPFGILVILGATAGALMSMDRCRQRGLDTEKMILFIACVLGFGFVIAHMVDAVFYQWDSVADNPLYLLSITSGLSSYGGFIGAAIGALVWRRHTKNSFVEFGDITTSTWPIAWLFGRTGCALVHDHVGALSNAWFAVRFPEHLLVDGFEGRYDLGLIELVFTVPLAIVVTWLWRSQPKRAPGFYMGVCLTAYAPVRFGLDFLRVSSDDPLFPGVTDPRYVGLTFAQWACFGALGVGVLMLSRSVGKPYKRTAPEDPEQKALRKELEKRRKRKKRKK